MKRTYIFLLSAIPVALFGNSASSDLVITTDMVSDAADGSLSAGDVVTLTMTMDGTARAGVCATSLSLECETGDIVILSVEINPAFSLIFEESSEPLPGSTYSTVRAQPLSTMDRSLGARGEPVIFAKVEIEVVSLTDFASDLTLNAKGITIGRRSARTVTRGPNDSGPGNSGSLHIPLGNRGPDIGVFQIPWDLIPETLSFEVRRC